MVLRPKVLIGGGALLVVSAAAGAGLTYGRTGPEPLKDAVLRYEQSAQAVKVYVRNPNRTWGLRNQRIVIVLVGEQRNILRSYGPDERNTYAGAPGQFIACCLIDTLPPGDEFVFTLWPLKNKLAGVTIQLDGEPTWQRWST